MKILEFGDDSKRKIILIHGFQCPWQVWNKYIDICGIWNSISFCLNKHSEIAGSSGKCFT